MPAADSTPAGDRLAGLDRDIVGDLMGDTARDIALPPLPLAEWEQTKDTLHLFAQVVGKVRLASTPRRNHWWNVPLYVTPRGLTTSRMWQGPTCFQIDFDLIDNELVIGTSGGEVRRLALRDGLSVSEFHAHVMATLTRLGVPVTINAAPYGVPMTTPFAADIDHASYDPEAVSRFWRALLWTDAVLEEFAGWYTGKTSPVHLFWHSFDLALTRFSGRRVEPPPTGDPVSREAYSHEVISFGFWAGNEQVPRPAFYSYTAPEPEGLTDRPLQPAAAYWNTGANGSLALLDYDDVRAAAAPRDAVLAFFQSAYEAGVDAAEWPPDLLTPWCPTAAELLDRLQAPRG